MGAALGNKNASRPVLERFLEKVMPEPNSGCWLWLGAVSAPPKKQKYARFSYVRDGKVKTGYAHRFAFEHFTGQPPGDLTVDHLCLTHCCVNPAHLRLLTAGENVAGANRRRAHGRT